MNGYSVLISNNVALSIPTVRAHSTGPEERTRLFVIRGEEHTRPYYKLIYTLIKYSTHVVIYWLIEVFAGRTGIYRYTEMEVFSL